MAVPSSVETSRRYPYAPVSALHGFLKAIRNTRSPARIDVAYLKTRALARGNEAAFVSALKFLGVVDGRGRPTTAFRKLQSGGDAGKVALANLVRVAYRPALEAGALATTDPALRAWFSDNSSPSQAANAARFFREICEMAGISLATEGAPTAVEPSVVTRQGRLRPSRSTSMRQDELLQKVPGYREWKGSPEDYVRALELWESILNPRREQSKRPAAASQSRSSR